MRPQALQCTSVLSWLSVYLHTFLPSGPRAPWGRNWAIHACNQHVAEALPWAGCHSSALPWTAHTCLWDTVWSSIPGCFTFVPSMLVPSRTGGKRPLDMHRVCGLISGRGQGDREKKGPEGSKAGAGSNWEVPCSESGRLRPCAGHHPTESSARLLQSWGYTPTLELPSSKQQKPHSHPGQGGSEPCPLPTLLLWLTQAWQEHWGLTAQEGAGRGLVEVAAGQGPHLARSGLWLLLGQETGWAVRLQKALGLWL